jgi:hypothetical protein
MVFKTYQLYRGGQFYWCGTPEYPATILMVNTVTVCIKTLYLKHKSINHSLVTLTCFLFRIFISNLFCLCSCLVLDISCAFWFFILDHPFGPCWSSLFSVLCVFYIIFVFGVVFNVLCSILAVPLDFPSAISKVYLQEQHGLHHTPSVKM